MAPAVTTERHEAAIARLAARRAIRGALLWGGISGFVFLISGLAYLSAFATEAERLELARDMAGNPAFEAMFGPARELDTLGGFVTWRVGWFIALAVGAWGFLTATRLLRGEEDEGRWDTLLSGPVTRAGATAATLAAIGLTVAALWAATAAGILLLGALEGQIPVLEGLYLALAVTAPAAVFAAVGALTSQLAPGRREAAGLAAAVFGLAFAARVAADASESLDWLRWTTPFGWVSEMRPFADPRPAALLPLLASTALLSGVAIGLARIRDVGGAALALRSDRRPRTALLGSPLASAARAALGGLAGWAAGLASFGVLYGVLSRDMAETLAAGIRIQETLEEIGVEIEIATVEGVLGLVFLFLAIAVSLYPATHVTAWREEESHGRLDVLLAQPHGRRAWLAGRAGVALAATVLLAALTGIAAWAGAAVRGAGVSAPAMLEAGINMAPIAALFLGIGVLLFGLLPRHAGPLLYGGIAAAYLWELVGSIVDAPEAVLALSPFHHMALVPAESIDLAASATMLAAGLLASIAGLELFRRRDLIGA